MSGVVETSITDHYPVLLSTYLDIHLSNAPIKKIFRDHSDISIHNLRSEMIRYIKSYEEDTESDIQSRTKNFHENLYRLYDKSI